MAYQVSFKAGSTWLTYQGDEPMDTKEQAEAVAADYRARGYKTKVRAVQDAGVCPGCGSAIGHTKGCYRLTTEIRR